VATSIDTLSPTTNPSERAKSPGHSVAEEVGDAGEVNLAQLGTEWRLLTAIRSPSRSWFFPSRSGRVSVCARVPVYGSRRAAQLMGEDAVAESWRPEFAYARYGTLRAVLADVASGVLGY
jgi:hypothetical protein